MARLVSPHNGEDKVIRLSECQELALRELKKAIGCDCVNVFEGSGGRQIVFDAEAEKKELWRNALASAISECGEVRGRAVILERASGYDDCWGYPEPTLPR
jgi:sugar phosphate isomerase/epimerase